MKFFIPFLILFFSLILLTACHKEESDPDGDPNLTINQKMNKFIEKQMKDIYFWADQVRDRNITTDQPPQEFLKGMMYEEDKWSLLEENEEMTKTSSEGTATTLGYQMKFYTISEKIDHIVGVICYVYPGSPAETAGLKRGNMIVMNNEEWLTKSNYAKVLSDATVKLRRGIITSTHIQAYDPSLEITAKKIDIDPILLDTVLEVRGNRIGYLVYTNFVDNQRNSLSELNEAINSIKGAGIDEFILDLRYNPGGTETAAQRLCSLLAPSKNVQQKDLLIHRIWNDVYEDKYKNHNTFTELHLDPAVLSYNLNLQNIYILTSQWTASASEVLISGLRPYFSNMILIGETTVGKYAGMTKTVPEESELKKWALWPITFAYTNSNSESVRGGINPDYFVEEKLYNPPFGEEELYLPPFGDPNDPLLSKALELITGEPVTTARSIRSTPFPLVPLTSANKREGILIRQ